MKSIFEWGGFRWFFVRWYYYRRGAKDYAKLLNRAATVEQYLLDCYHNKKDLPDRYECLRLAQMLGTDETVAHLATNLDERRDQ
jgi:hypothetical protein